MIITLGIGATDSLTPFITTGLEIGEVSEAPTVFINFNVQTSDIIDSNVQTSDIINLDTEVG